MIITFINSLAFWKTISCSLLITRAEVTGHSWYSFIMSTCITDHRIKQLFQVINIPEQRAEYYDSCLSENQEIMKTVAWVKNNNIYRTVAIIYTLWMTHKLWYFHKNKIFANYSNHNNNNIGRIWMPLLATQSTGSNGITYKKR